MGQVQHLMQTPPPDISYREITILLLLATAMEIAMQFVAIARSQTGAKTTMCESMFLQPN